MILGVIIGGHEISITTCLACLADKVLKGNLDIT